MVYRTVEYIVGSGGFKLEGIVRRWPRGPPLLCWFQLPQTTSVLAAEMHIFLLIFIRGLRGPYGKGHVGHCTSGHSSNPPLTVGRWRTGGRCGRSGWAESRACWSRHLAVSRPSPVCQWAGRQATAMWTCPAAVQRSRLPRRTACPAPSQRPSSRESSAPASPASPLSSVPVL